jgi:hypothetical protein
MNEEIKWSKKEVVERPFLNYRKDREPMPGQKYKVNVYRWGDYRLEKELYGENRMSYHIAKGDSYLCDMHSANPSVKFFSNMKSATLSLKHCLENGLRNRECWANPEEEFIWGLMA